MRVRLILQGEPDMPIAQLGASGLRERLERLAIDHCRPAPQSDGAGRQLRRLFAGALVYHFLRRFPAWAGSLPAHKPRIQTLRPDGQGQPDEAT
ncbi:phospholipase [Bordetella pertussis]|nr:phospholipase [Bordetella pertussis]